MKARSAGAGLARHLRTRKVFVIEVMRTTASSSAQGQVRPRDYAEAAGCGSCCRPRRRYRRERRRRPHRDDPGAHGIESARSRLALEGYGLPAGCAVHAYRTVASTSYELSGPAGWSARRPSSRSRAAGRSPPATGPAPPRPLPLLDPRMGGPVDAAFARLATALTPRLTEALGSAPTRPGRYWSPPATTRTSSPLRAACDALQLLTDPPLQRPGRHRLDDGDRQADTGRLPGSSLSACVSHQPTKDYVDGTPRKAEQTRDRAGPRNLRRPRGLHSTHPKQQKEPSPPLDIYRSITLRQSVNSGRDLECRGSRAPRRRSRSRERPEPHSIEHLPPSCLARLDRNNQRHGQNSVSVEHAQQISSRKTVG